MDSPALIHHEHQEKISQNIFACQATGIMAWNCSENECWETDGKELYSQVVGFLFVCLFLPLLILPNNDLHIFSPYMQVALQFTKARIVIYCMTFSFLICLENSIFIILVLLSDNHILANVMCLFHIFVYFKCDVGDAELFIHPP